MQASMSGSSHLVPVQESALSPLKKAQGGYLVPAETIQELPEREQNIDVTEDSKSVTEEQLDKANLYKPTLKQMTSIETDQDMNNRDDTTLLG